MYNLKLLVLLLTVLIANKQVCGQLSCYVCVSSETGLCGDKFSGEASILKRNCSSQGSPVCFKSVIKLVKEKFITRGCAETDICANGSAIYEECYSCNSNYCNTAFTVSSSSIGVILVSFTVLKHFCSVL